MLSPDPNPTSTRLEDALRLPGNTGRTRRFRAGEVLFSVGEPGNGFFLIESGRVQISAPVTGGEPRVLAILGPGDTVGEMAVIDDGPRSATARAETDTETKHVTRDELLLLLEKQPVIALDLFRELSRRMRALNRKYLDEVVQAERLALVGRFARSIVHDFKNPLAIIGLATELAAGDRVTPAERRRAKGQIDRQVERMVIMMQELIEFTKPGEQHTHFRLIKFSRFLAPLTGEIRRDLAERHVTLDAENDPPAVEVRIDPQRLSRLFYNLVNNAVDAMPEGGSIRLRFQQSPEVLRVDIEDSGHGIAPEVAATLFVPFTTHGKAHGTGLGLTICKRIIEDHGGRIWAAASKPGKGATFSFTLPLAT